jgi:hypothetical protein
MTAQEHIVSLLRELNLPIEQYVVTGSGVLALRNLRPIRDLDIIVRKRLWKHMETDPSWVLVGPDPDDPERKNNPPHLEQRINGVLVNVFQDYKHAGFFVDAQYHLENPEWVSAENQMWPCVSLNHILQWKIQADRTKDRHDVQLINDYLAGGSSVNA